MNKKIVMFCLGFIFVFVENIQAEPYTGKEVPTDELLAVTFSGSDIVFTKSIGKIKNGDIGYTIFFEGFLNI